MAVLVIAEHDNKTLKRATLQAVDAATRLGEVHLLVLGSGVDAVAQAAAKVAGVAQVKVVDDAALAEPLAEVVTAQVVPLAKDYSHVVAAATAHGKDFMPRVAALLDVAQISEVTGIDSADTFRRPIYAGNAIATVQSSDPIKVLTVRGTSFDEAAAEGGSASIEKVAAVAVDGQPALVGREQASSDRPELTTTWAAGGWAAPSSSRPCWSRWPTGWVPPWGPRVRRWTPAMRPMTGRWARPARSLRRSSTSRPASRGPSSTWPA